MLKDYKGKIPIVIEKRELREVEILKAQEA